MRELSYIKTRQVVWREMVKPKLGGPVWEDAPKAFVTNNTKIVLRRKGLDRAQSRKTSNRAKVRWRAARRSASTLDPRQCLQGRGPADSQFPTSAEMK